MLHIISKTYSLLIFAQIVSFELLDAIHNNPFRRFGLIFLTIPVIYHLIQELFFKSKSAENNNLKIYSFAYICLYVLWCLFDIIYYIYYGRHIWLHGYYALCECHVVSCPVYIVSQNLFLKAKFRYIFLLLMWFNLGASFSRAKRKRFL